MLVSRRRLRTLTARLSSPQLQRPAGWRRGAASDPIRPKLHPTQFGDWRARRAASNATAATLATSSLTSPNIISERSIDPAQTSKMEEELLVPKRLPDDTHEVIVVLETIHVPMPEVDTGCKTHEVLLYKYTGPKDVAARIKNASIVFVTTCTLSAESLGEAPYL